MWKIAHAEHRDDGAVSVCSLAFVDQDEHGKPRKTVYQLQTAIRIPPHGLERELAVAVLRQVADDLLKPVVQPDVAALEAELNAEAK